MFIHKPPSPKLIDLKSVTSPSGQRQYTTPNGDVYPSITTVLGSKPKPFLDDWRKSLGKQKADKETERCAIRGTAVHLMAERYLDNDLDLNNLREFKPEYIKLFNQIKILLNKISNIRMQEVALWSDDIKVAGRVDCIGEYAGVLSVIDFKTSNNNKDRSMIDDYFKQCCFYALAWYERTGERIDNMVIIMTVERGMVPLVFEEKVEDWIEPLLLDVAKYQQDNTQQKG